MVAWRPKICPKVSRTQHRRIYTYRGNQILGRLLFSQKIGSYFLRKWPGREGIDGVESDNDVPSPHAYLGSGEMIHREGIDGVESDNVG